MEHGIRRGLHIDEDEGGQKYEYGGRCFFMKDSTLAAKKERLKKD